MGGAFLKIFRKFGNLGFSGWGETCKLGNREQGKAQGKLCKPRETLARKKLGNARRTIFEYFHVFPEAARRIRTPRSEVLLARATNAAQHASHGKILGAWRALGGIYLDPRDTWVSFTNSPLLDIPDLLVAGFCAAGFGIFPILPILPPSSRKLELQSQNRIWVLPNLAWTWGCVACKPLL